MVPPILLFRSLRAGFQILFYNSAPYSVAILCKNDNGSSYLVESLPSS